MIIYHIGNLSDLYFCPTYLCKMSGQIVPSIKLVSFKELVALGVLAIILSKSLPYLRKTYSLYKHVLVILSRLFD